MYYIEELFCRLANGVLSNTNFSTNTEDANTDPIDIRQSRKTTVTVALNEALNRLHSRFILRENSVIVEMQEGRTNYPLLKKFAVQSYDPEEVQDPFIMDLSGEAFDEDVIKILSVWDSFNRQRHLNDRDQPWSVFTPRPNVLQNTRPIRCEALTVVYQAKHPKVHCDEVGSGVIDIPDTLSEALDAYIAYKCLSGIGTQEATAKSVEHLQRYEDICQEVNEFDLVNTSQSNTTTKFRTRGFV